MNFADLKRRFAVVEIEHGLEVKNISIDREYFAIETVLNYRNGSPTGLKLKLFKLASETPSSR